MPGCFLSEGAHYTVFIYFALFKTKVNVMIEWQNGSVVQAVT